MMIELFGALSLASAQADPPPGAHLGEIRMHLFYQGTGRLSRDISPPSEFVGWNTVIGEGSAEESADDLVVVVEVRANGHQFVERPLRIVARGSNGRILGQRRSENVLTTSEGRAYLALWLPGVACAGTIQISANFGNEERTETLSLDCGE